MKTCVRHWKIHYGGFWHHFLDFRRHPLARLRWGYACVVELVRYPEPMVRRVRWEDMLAESAGATPVLVREATTHTDAIFQRAARRLERSKYNLVFFNCEHFANECMIGRRRSRQVREKSAQASLAVTGSMAATLCLRQPDASMLIDALGLGFLGVSIVAAALFLTFVVRSQRALARARRRRALREAMTTAVVM